MVREWVGRHFWGIAMLIGLCVVSAWTVRHFKEPGQMTVLESQAMDMTAMRPPVGSVPVATELVSAGEFSSTVRYTGSVAPYTEQDIFPRVDGWLTGLKVYNGDRVRAGQLLAVLDAPDIRDRLSEADYGHSAAMQEVPVARAELARAGAERSAARGEVEVAGQEVRGAGARVAAAQREVTRAQKDLQSAEANLKYWSAEIRREASLLQSGAVSRQEYESEEAQHAAAAAEVENRRAAVEAAAANVEAAQAELGGRQAAERAARDRAAAADAALSGAAGRVGQRMAEAKMAGARKSAAGTFDRYRAIRAPFDGVVTRRYVSPGVLVGPGTAVLNIAQLERVRLQAHVAERDLARIRVGAKVTARLSDGRAIQAAVTSISPSADPASRTSIVEAVVGNPGRLLLPGQFVSLEISTSSTSNAVTVPSAAIVERGGRQAVWVARRVSGGRAVYTCPMHPEVVSDKPGDCPKCGMPLVKREADTGRTARLVYVTTGGTSGSRTEVVRGLQPGDEVIYKGHRYLREGDAVSPVQWDAAGPEQLPPPAAGDRRDDM